MRECPKCHQEFTGSQLIEAIREKKSIICPHCGSRAVVEAIMEDIAEFADINVQALLQDIKDGKTE